MLPRQSSTATNPSHCNGIHDKLPLRKERFGASLWVCVSIIWWTSISTACTTESQAMTDPDSPSQIPDTRGLVAAISRNTSDGSLGRFLESFRWSVLSAFVRPQRLQRGHLLIAQGDKDRKIYFLESGSLKVDIRTDGGLVQLAILGPGTVVGEGSFFSHLARNASVAAYSDCTVWEMGPQEFSKLSHQHPNVALALAMALGAVMASRMLDLSNRITVT